MKLLLYQCILLLLLFLRNCCCWCIIVFWCCYCVTIITCVSIVFPVVKLISPIFNILRQSATDCVPIKETKAKQKREKIFRKHRLQYSDIHDIKALYVYNIHSLGERLSLRFILSIFPWFDVSSSGCRFPSLTNGMGMQWGCFSKLSFFANKQANKQKNVHILSSYFH